MTPDTSSTNMTLWIEQRTRKEHALATEVDDLDLDDFDDLDEEEEEKSAPRKKASKKEKPKGIGASAVAEKMGADPKTFRAWLRRKVASGDLEIEGHEHKSRYTWKNWKDPELVAVMTAWKEDPHERGGGPGRPKGSAKEKKGKTATKRKKKKTS